MLPEFMKKHQLSEAFKKNALKRFIPLAEEIVSHQLSANKTYYIGINGCQGSGKSTFSSFLKEYIEDQHKLNVTVLSLDDFYLSKSDRLALSVKIHPLFETRGVPGTHNIPLLKQVLTSLQQPGKCLIPRFDKSTDNPFPETQWEEMDAPADIVLLEGWCWGVNHQSVHELDVACNALESEEDSSGVWRHFVNQQIKSNYEPLYSLMNYWVMLKAPDFENVFAWRLEQENKMIKALGHSGSAAMDEGQIQHFIQYFQRLTEHSLKTLTKDCNLVYELNQNREIIRSLVREQ